MKKLLLLSCLLSSYHIFCQTTITGTVTDTLQNPLVAATIMLLDTDSTLVEFTQTDASGKYTFNRIARKDYLIKATYVSFIPVTLPISCIDKKLEVPNIEMVEIAEELMEVVIKAAKAPMKLRGDTIEYDATTFKVPEGSTVEDLLRRLPGLEVERDGSLKADGKTISKVTVEGKDFFGGDPTTVTKNLPAEGVSKVQVFDKKSEEEQLTGIKSISEEKEMNITLKDEFKAGGFGKVIVSGGSESTGELKGNYNKFNDKHQFSLVGIANNTGKNGLGWDDYQDFMGSRAFNFNSDGMYGFGSGGAMRFFTFGSNAQNSLENQISSAFFSGRQGGFPTNGNAGVNYNYDHKKTEIGAVYFLNYNANEKLINNTNTTFFDNFTTSQFRKTDDMSNFTGHRAEFKLEQKIDSFNTLVVSADLANIVSKTDVRNQSSAFKNETNLTSLSNITNATRMGGSLVNTTALWRKRFRKKGRFLGANVGYTNTNIDDRKNLNSVINFFGTNLMVDSTQTLRQQFLSNANKGRFSANAMFSEPLSKVFFLSMFTNYGATIQEGNVDVDDIADGGSRSNNEFLTRAYTNEISFYRSGAKITFSKDGFNLGLGGAYQEFFLMGDFTGGINSPFKGTVDQSFGDWLPYANISITLGRSSNLDFSYTKNIEQPNIDDLLPIVNNSNPLFITEGNQNLLPTNSHNFNFFGSYAIPVLGLRLYANGSAAIFENQNIQSQIVDPNTLITRSKPVNYEGGFSTNAYLGLSLPIIKNKVKASINYGMNQNKSFAFVNNLLNETNTTSHQPRWSLDITPNENLGLYLNANLGLTNTQYNISTSQNQEIIERGLGATFNAKIVKNLFFTTSYDHSFFRNDRFNVDTDIPIINGAIYYQFLKGNKGEIRFSIFDLLNKNIGFNQFAGANIVSQTSTTSLARFGLLSFTYNLRGMTASVINNNW